MLSVAAMSSAGAGSAVSPQSRCRRDGPSTKTYLGITVQVDNGDWHYTRTPEPMPFDLAVRTALVYEAMFSLKGGRLVSIANVDPPQT